MTEHVSSASGFARSRAIGKDLFTWPAQSPALLGSRCLDCNGVAFPVSANCMRCGSLEVEVIELPRRGRLWAWTIQRFMPKSPYRSSETDLTFTPYGIGYVELSGALRVEARLTESDPTKLRIGAEMELVVYVHRIEADGEAVMNYAFRPV